MNAVMHSDGGARGNPGPAAIGVVLEFDDASRPPLEISERIGETTNNVAEYMALLSGLRAARDAGVKHLRCLLDSELVVKQLQGAYRVRDARLKTLADQALQLVREFTTVTFESVPRKENTRADALVNTALDAETSTSRESGEE